jgi:hypothetical protein
MSDAEWDEYIDVLYERWVAEHEAYAFEDNYEPFEQCKLYFQTVNPKQVNRS